jgi:hypothetical protein
MANRHVARAVKAAFDQKVFKDGADKCAHWTQAAACIAVSPGSATAAKEWQNLLLAQIKRTVRVRS